MAVCAGDNASFTVTTAGGTRMSGTDRGRRGNRGGSGAMLILESY